MNVECVAFGATAHIQNFTKKAAPSFDELGRDRIC